MTLVTELESVEDFIKSCHPTSVTEKQTVPLKPSDNTFVVRFLNDERESETGYHYRIDREYQVVHIGETAEDVLTRMDVLSTALYQRQLIPLQDSSRFICVESFSFSQPFQTENKKFACIGVLSTEIREARVQDQYEKIMNVHARFE